MASRLASYGEEGQAMNNLMKHLSVLILGSMFVAASQAHAQPANLVLQDTTISTTALFTASNSITAGPSFTIAATGDAIFRTGRYIYFRPGIVIIQGGKLRTILDPTLVSVRTLEAPIPANFTLQQNYPNPFNPSTNIRFAVKEKSHVSLMVFDLLGQSIATLVNEELAPGEYEARFSPNGLANGVYIYRMRTSGFTQSRRMLLLK